MQINPALLGVLFGLLITIPLLAYALWYSLRAKREWMEASVRLGFSPYTKRWGSGGMDGALHGLRCGARWEQRGSGKGSHTITIYWVELASMTPPELAISREGLFAKVTKLVGAQDVQVGDAEFDQLYIIKGRSEAQVREYLAPHHRREALRALTAADLPWWISDGKLICEQYGMARGDKLEATMRLMAAQAYAHLYGQPPHEGSGGW